jgi:hypothetical protein
MTRAEKNSGKSAEKAVSSQDDAYSTWRHGRGRQVRVRVPIISPILTGGCREGRQQPGRRIEHQGADAAGSHAVVDILNVCSTHRQRAMQACICCRATERYQLH